VDAPLVGEVEGEAEALDADAEADPEAADADEWLTELTELEEEPADADTDATDEVDVATLSEDAPTTLEALEDAVDEAAALAEAVRQLLSVPAWMVIGEEYWTVPELSRTWMVM